MTYPYSCPQCGEHREVVRPASEAADSVTCSCGYPMERVWTVPYAAVSTNESYYDAGLGCVINNKFDKLDAVKRIGGEQVRTQHYKDENGVVCTRVVREPGIDIVEVGSEKKAASGLAPKAVPYVLPRGALDGIPG